MQIVTAVRIQRKSISNEILMCNCLTKTQLTCYDAERKRERKNYPNTNNTNLAQMLSNRSSSSRLLKERNKKALHRTFYVRRAHKTLYKNLYLMWCTFHHIFSSIHNIINSDISANFIKLRSTTRNVNGCEWEWQRIRDREKDFTIILPRHFQNPYAKGRERKHYRSAKLLQRILSTNIKIAAHFFSEHKFVSI